MPGDFADKTGYLMVEVADKERDFLIMMVADKDLINLNIYVDVIDFLVYWRLRAEDDVEMQGRSGGRMLHVASGVLVGGKR